MYVSEEEELPRVMREISDALNGIGAALTVHPDDGYPERVVYAPEEAGISCNYVEHLLARRILKVDPTNAGQHLWHSHEFNGRQLDALLLPVQRVPEHSQLIITVFYETLDDTMRRKAEAVYLDRRPFATGYFRLWQVNRAHLRRTAATEAALNLMSLAIVLVSAAGTILYTNDAARSLLEEADGLRERDGRLSAAALADTMRLQAAMSHVSDPTSRQTTSRLAAMFTVPRSERLPLIVSVRASAELPEEPGDTAATVIAVDPALSTDAWLIPVCKLFQLTNVEAGLASLLVSGSTLTAAASQLRIRDATAKSYLKQIFLKTGANRQSELVRVLLSSIVRTRGAGSTEVI